MDSNNLLSFVNSASSNIQEALGKAPKRRRNVTVKKFAENRVKRLDSKKPRPVTANLTTKGKKSSQLKPCGRLPSLSLSSVGSLLQHSNTWPSINSSSLPPTTTINSMQTSFYSSSETKLNSSSRTIDPELESLLSELESGPPSVPISRHGSSESVYTAPSCTPPLSTLDAQVYIGEQAFSPYSDCSDEMDSAYCSPGNNAQVSYCCSPNLPDWCPTDLLPPLNVNTTCMQEVSQGQGMISPRCNWVSQADSLPLAINTTTSSASVYDQGPPMTPTVSQLLEQYHTY